MPHMKNPPHKRTAGLRKSVTLGKAQTTPTASPAQLNEGREHEREARRYALAALGLAGGLALQHAALSRFYAGRAASLIAGDAQ